MTRQAYETPVLTEYGTIYGLTKGVKTIGVSDGFILQDGTGLENVSPA